MTHSRRRKAARKVPSLFYLCLLPTIARAYHQPASPPTVVVQAGPNLRMPPASAAAAAVRQPMISPPQRSSFQLSFPSLTTSDANLPGLPEYRSQDQQVNAALPLGGTVRGKWRIREERGPAMSPDGKTSKICTSTITFRGFLDEQQGIVDYVSGDCDERSTGGRWVSKTTRVVQMTVRWKMKTSSGPFIYKGFVDAGSTVGRSGSVSAEMKGLILTGKDSNNVAVGKFTADLIKKFDSTDVKIGDAGGRPIGFEPKSAEAAGSQ